jgi:hypothetical protein
MNIFEIKNYSKKAFLVNIVIMSLFTILGIISIIQYITIKRPYDNFSFIIIGKILFGLSIIFYLKIIFEFIITIIMFVNEKLIKTKLYFLLIPLIILSIIYFYVFFSITFGGYSSIDYLVVGFPLILLAICIPIGQIIWINIIENKIYIIISIIMSVFISILLFIGIFTRMLNI